MLPGSLTQRIHPLSRAGKEVAVALETGGAVEATWMADIVEVEGCPGGGDAPEFHRRDPRACAAVATTGTSLPGPYHHVQS